MHRPFTPVLSVPALPLLSSAVISTLALQRHSTPPQTTSAVNYPTSTLQTFAVHDSPCLLFPSNPCPYQTRNSPPCLLYHTASVRFDSLRAATLLSMPLLPMLCRSLFDLENAPTHAAAIFRVRATFTETNLHANPRQEVGNVFELKLIRVETNPNRCRPREISRADCYIWLPGFDSRHVVLPCRFAMDFHQRNLRFSGVSAIRLDKDRQL